jgi:hypothetical protein
MPVPRPQKDEDKNKFMSRCIGFMHDENKKKQDKDKWTNEQMVAICYSQWGKKGKATTTNEEQENDEQFIERFLAKYPQYKKYFEEEEQEL